MKLPKFLGSLLRSVALRKTICFYRKTRVEKSKGSFPPGEYISDELRARDWSVEHFSGMIGYSLASAKSLISGEMSISAEIARTLAKVFGTSEQLWLNLQEAYDQSRMGKAYVCIQVLSGAITSVSIQPTLEAARKYLAGDPALDNAHPDELYDLHGWYHNSEILVKGFDMEEILSKGGK